MKSKIGLKEYSRLFNTENTAIERTTQTEIKLCTDTRKKGLPQKDEIFLWEEEPQRREVAARNNGRLKAKFAATTRRKSNMKIEYE